MKKMNVALIGFGRSGKNIHSQYFLSADNDKVAVLYVVDAMEGRRKMAEKAFGCTVLSDYRDLFGKKDIDLVVNASYSHMHYEITKDLLSHGFNVLVEKPFSRTYYECCDLILTAKKHNVIVSAFHQSLYTPAYKKIKEIIQSGRLGRILQINLKYSGFARRWDWQTLQNRCGGGVYNTGPHPIGQALDFLGWDERTEVRFSDLDLALTSGDADDYAKIILSCPGKPVVDIEINSADAYAGDYVFKIYGTRGTLLSDNAEYRLKTVDLDSAPPRPVIEQSLCDPDLEPIYCREDLPVKEETGAVTGTSFDVAVKEYYDMLYGAVMQGKKLAVTPEMAAMVIKIIESTHVSNPLPVTR